VSAWGSCVTTWGSPNNSAAKSASGVTCVSRRLCNSSTAVTASRTPRCAPCSIRSRKCGIYVPAATPRCSARAKSSVPQRAGASSNRKKAARDATRAATLAREREDRVVCACGPLLLAQRRAADLVVLQHAVRINYRETCNLLAVFHGYHDVAIGCPG